ncbi:MAG: cisplatin damage response ATP-dependent DNA ligase [Beijerinckiaceae bacterium]
MKSFAAMLDRLAFEASRNGKLRILQDYLRHTPDPDRGYALAAITGDLTFANAKAGTLRALIAERTDPVLFAMSYDYVGDLSETIALLWPAPGSASGADDVRLSTVVDILEKTGRANLPGVLAGLLDRLDENGRWALLKLITGGLRIGVSARLARTALAANAGVDVDQIEDMWPSLEPPYSTLFAWIDGDAEKPAHTSAVVFRPAMLAHAIDEKDFSTLDPADFMAEWKWDGIRIQAALTREDGCAQVRLYSRTGENIGHSFPDVEESLLAFEGGGFVLDGELLIVTEGKVASFSTLQQRLNRKKVTAKLASDFPAHIRAYDLLSLDGRDLRDTPFEARRQLLEAFVAKGNVSALTISPQLEFASWDELAAARADPLSAGAGEDAQAVEGVMLKRKDSPYVAGRPKGLWYKWKRDPFSVDAVLMYAQRGHGKRSSFYSDYTFGVWRATPGGEELVPVGKAYFGFTDAELKQLDKFVRDNTVNRFGPVREVAASAGKGLVLEVAFEGLQRSPRHKSGLAMRFPRVARIRWDKPASEADRIETLEVLLDTQR